MQYILPCFHYNDYGGETDPSLLVAGHLDIGSTLTGLKMRRKSLVLEVITCEADAVLVTRQM